MKPYLNDRQKQQLFFSVSGAVPAGRTHREERDRWKAQTVRMGAGTKGNGARKVEKACKNHGREREFSEKAQFGTSWNIIWQMLAQMSSSRSPQIT
jgi:hypothetical protein